jgi:adenine-specific DNA-methyltransferase
VRLDPTASTIRILDPGAGVGSLGAALLKRLAAERPGTTLHLTAFEVEPDLLPALERTRDAAHAWAQADGLDVTFEIEQSDFVTWAAERLGGLWRGEGLFDLAIMNPPYAKIATRSDHRLLTAHVACEVTNLYAAFVALAVEALRDGGRLVAITPRSFTNGPYFRAFRLFLDQRVAFETVDLFESRSALFADTDVLQENVVYSLVRQAERLPTVTVTFHDRHGGAEAATMAYNDFMPRDDPERFIHLRNGDSDHGIATMVNRLPAKLSDLGLDSSTGRVVDFRVREHLLAAPSGDSAPLLYPQHLRRGQISWPIPGGKKPNALAVNEKTISMLLPRGHYVAVKRFTSKEERRRVTPTWVPEQQFDSDLLAFENHLNVFHRRGRGLDRDLAVGLTLYLQCSTVDSYFRQFSGHTQVNATDLRSLRYPEEQTLRHLGSMVSDPAALTQEQVDALMQTVVWDDS